jgi:hypothetical protein
VAHFLHFTPKYHRVVLAAGFGIALGSLAFCRVLGHLDSTDCIIKAAVIERRTVATKKPTSQKRAREKARIDRQKEKEAKRLEAKERKAAAPPRSSEGEDPDLAGIRLGPQPRPEWLEGEEEAEDNET